MRPPARSGRRRTSIVARRRRWLLGLLAVTTVTVVLAAVGVISWPLQFVVDVVLVAFCIHLRSQARRALAVARQRRPAATPAAPVARPTAAPAVAAARMRPARRAAPVPADRGWPDPAETVVVAATGTDSAEATDDTWEPVPVPLPTYAMKPPAPAYQADPTYTDPVYAPSTPAAEAAEAVASDEVVDADLDDILERRWAVND